MGTVDDLIENYQKINVLLIEFGRAYYKVNVFNNSSIIKVKDLNLKYGKSLPKSKRNKGSVPLIASNGIIDFSNSFNAKNAVVFGCRGTLGKVFFQQGECFVLNTAFFINNSSNYGNLFFAIDFQNGFVSYKSGAAQPQITLEAINKSELLLLFDDKLNYIISLHAQNQSIIKKLNKVKSILLNKYFTNQQ
ncbi:type I restriction modification DNA specificity protein [Metamycoplasma subdolum]|uniref:Type I restriction modification DNA specificity protein n=1 Tax=Metamycoplasma subdolum TaxID=92407 RepID=A0A3M0A538_9BACT|nr:restriction endonuclease subunit S [Metamycoplasma subdolum]RMA78619.1 type I restriction modification DNA specificity protein [Metamycoplasma subdolum]WPB50779.1 restriction endonuclease subunit S [Metamycoplasma subdolum]